MRAGGGSAVREAAPDWELLAQSMRTHYSAMESARMAAHAAQYQLGARGHRSGQPGQHNAIGSPHMQRALDVGAFPASPGAGASGSPPHSPARRSASMSALPISPTPAHLLRPRGVPPRPRMPAQALSPSKHMQGVWKFAVLARALRAVLPGVTGTRAFRSFRGNALAVRRMRAQRMRCLPPSWFFLSLFSYIAPPACNARHLLFSSLAASKY